MPLKLILFDLDGTLTDSAQDITNALNYAIGPYGFKPLTVKETIGLVGEGITKLVEKVILINQADKPFPETVEKEALIRRFVAYYSEHAVDNTTLYPGVKETLSALAGYRKAVISNKREPVSRLILERLDIAHHFDLIVGGDTTKGMKPSPEPIFFAMSRLGALPGETIMVGDSELDILAGKNAGILTIAVTYGYRPAELLKEADHIIDSLYDLPGIVNSLL